MASWALPLAAAGEVGETFFKERTSDTLPCQANGQALLLRLGEGQHRPLRDADPPAPEAGRRSRSLFGFAIAFALALLAHRRRWLQPPLLAATGVLYTIPSVAFFFLLLPLTGRGVDTAIIALTAYTLQIIYRNTIVGLANVPTSVKDAARGHGPDRAPAPLAGRAAAGDAGDHRRAADRDRQHGRDRDPGGRSPAAAGSATPIYAAASTSRPTSSSPAGSRS